MSKAMASFPLSLCNAIGLIKHRHEGNRDAEGFFPLQHKRACQYIVALVFKLLKSLMYRREACVWFFIVPALNNGAVRICSAPNGPYYGTVGRP